MLLCKGNSDTRGQIDNKASMHQAGLLTFINLNVFPMLNSTIYREISLIDTAIVWNSPALP